MTEKIVSSVCEECRGYDGFHFDGCNKSEKESWEELSMMFREDSLGVLEDYSDDLEIFDEETCDTCGDYHLTRDCPFS